jgi:hypothetical protein
MAIACPLSIFFFNKGISTVSYGMQDAIVHIPESIYCVTMKASLHYSDPTYLFLDLGKPHPEDAAPGWLSVAIRKDPECCRCGFVTSWFSRALACLILELEWWWFIVKTAVKIFNCESRFGGKPTSNFSPLYFT